MVLSSDCISVAMTVQTVMMNRLAAGAAAVAPGLACCVVRPAVPAAVTASVLHLREVQADTVQRAGGGGDLVIGQARQDGCTDTAGGGFGLFDDPQPPLGQADDLGPPIGVFLAAF